MWRIKLTTPVLIIHSIKLTIEKISILPSNREKWEDYFQQTYDTALSLLLVMLKSSYDDEHSDKKRGVS